MPRLTVVTAALAAGLAASAHADSLTVLDKGLDIWESDSSYADLGSEWVAGVRTVDSGSDAWALGVGNDLRGGGLADADLSWSNAVTYGFELAYDGDVMGLSIYDDQETLINRVHYDIASARFDTLMFQLKAGNDAPESSAMAMVTGLQWTRGGETSDVGRGFLASSMSNENVWAALGGAGDLGGSSWSLRGNVMFTWLGEAPSSDSTVFEFEGVQLVSVPVPAPLLLAGVGLLGAAGMRRRMTRG